MTPQIYKVHLNDGRTYYYAGLTPIGVEKMAQDDFGKNVICCITPLGQKVYGPPMVKDKQIKTIG